MPVTAAVLPGAIPLENLKQEAFAVARARGLSWRMAGLEAGYRGSASNFCRMGTKPHIKARIEYLKGEVATVERAPAEAWADAAAMKFPRDLTLTYYLTELRNQLAICRRDGDKAGAIRVLHLMGVAGGLIKLQRAPPPPKAGTKRGREAREDHDGEQQQRALSAPADESEEGLSEVLGFVDSMRSGPGDEPQA